ncbi:MAG TPA: DinB family protein [Vicinamibacterales bacterium]|nr:DinB family protein [Vicinamibacterales bacterium]
MLSTLPEDLQTIVSDVDAADRAAEAIAARVTDEAFQWQPDGGRRWSIAQCLDHLAAVNGLYTAAIRVGVKNAQALGWTRTGPAVPGFLGRRFIALQEPPVTRRVRAPEKVQPRPRRSREEIMKAYRDAHDDFRQLVSECAQLDVNRATFPNPFFSLVRVKVSTGLLVLPAHNRRHLWQAEQVEKDFRRRALPRER